MQSGSVYFMSGTFGSGGSSWMIAILAALATAFATFWVGYLLEEHKRQRDRRALAATLLAEISAILQLFDQLHIEERYRLRLSVMRKAQAESTTVQTVPGDALTFPVTVYEKCADRVGTLGADTATEVVRFYNFVNGFRSSVRIAVTSGELPIADRINIIEFMLGMVTAERPRASALQEKLRSVVVQRVFFQW